MIICYRVLWEREHRLSRAYHPFTLAYSEMYLQCVKGTHKPLTNISIKMTKEEEREANPGFYRHASYTILNRVSEDVVNTYIRLLYVRNSYSLRYMNPRTIEKTLSKYAKTEYQNFTWQNTIKKKTATESNIFRIRTRGIRVQQ